MKNNYKLEPFLNERNFENHIAITNGSQLLNSKIKIN